MTHEAHSAEFCKSLDSASSNTEIELENMDTVSAGAIHMPVSYGNHTKSKHCVVTFSGQGNGIIIFNHQRLNSANGPCLKQKTIDNEIHDGPCLEQRVYFRQETKITLIIGEPVLPGFVIYFKGTLQYAVPSMSRNCLPFPSIACTQLILVATCTLSRPWEQMETHQSIPQMPLKVPIHLLSFVF